MYLTYYKGAYYATCNGWGGAGYTRHEAIDKLMFILSVMKEPKYRYLKK